MLLQPVLGDMEVTVVAVTIFLHFECSVFLVPKFISLKIIIPLFPLLGTEEQTVSYIYT